MQLRVFKLAKSWPTLNLLISIILFQWALPDDFRFDPFFVEFALGLYRAGMDRFPEFVRRSFRDHGDGEGFGGWSGTAGFRLF